MKELLLALAGSLVLSAAHIVPAALRKLPDRYQAAVDSLAGGAGLSYVFLYLLFELVRDGASSIHSLLPLGPEPLESMLMLLLTSVLVIYLLQIRFSQSPTRDYKVLAPLFLIYNFLAGAGAVEEARWGGLNLALYVTAIGLHILCNDRFLTHLSQKSHGLLWRACLASAPLIGCALVLWLQPPKGALYTALTIVAGATIINVLRRELPGVGQLRPPFFILGAVGYSVLILTTWRF